MKSLFRLLSAFLFLGLFVSARADTFVNGGFEEPYAGPGTNTYPVTIPGWHTNDSSFEIWGSGFQGVPAYEGVQFAELNAFIAGTLYQDVANIGAGSRVGFQFAHRGRAGIDTMRFTLTDLGADQVIGGGDDTVLFTNVYADGTSAWGFYDASVLTPIYALGNTVRFAYTAIEFSSSSVGNFLDAADFGVGRGGVPIEIPGVPDAFSTLGLLGIGLGALITASRRRWIR
jgi:hypothetical protein